MPQLQRLLGACSIHTSSSHYQVPSPSVADPDPGSGAFLTPVSGMNNPDHISESLETIFWVKILKFFDADPGWKKCGSGIRDEKNLYPGSGMNIRNPQHCLHPTCSRVTPRDFIGRSVYCFLSSQRHMQLSTIQEVRHI